jgi:thymidylate synthase (FAD)
MVRAGDNKVELIGHYGGDMAHALSAWTSTSRELNEEKESRIPGLLKFLAENGHHTPFEKSSLHFLVTCDTASHIHILKHRVGVSVNGESARYKELNDDKAYLPNDWIPPSSYFIENRLVSRETTEISLIYDEYLDFLEYSYKKYHDALERLEPIVGRKRAKESARFFLPYGGQITIDVMFNWRSFAHFVNLRADSEAQKEIQEIAKKMLKLVKQTGDFDETIKAFGF